MKKWFKIGVLTILIAMMALTTVGAAGPPGAGWWTSFAIQNVTSSAGTLVVSAYQGDSGSVSGTYTTSDAIAADGALSYHPGFGEDLSQGRIDFDTSLPDGFIGAVVVSSDVSIVATGEVGNNAQGSVGVSGGTAKGQYQAVGGDKVASVIRFPVAKNNFAGQTTTFYIQAAGADADVTATFNMDNGSSYQQTYTIAANSMHVVSPDDAGVPSGQAKGGGSFGALTVASTTGPIAGVVCEHQHSTSPGTIVLATRGFTPGELGTKLYAPVIKHAFANAATTGLTVQNAEGSASITITATFQVYNVLGGSSASIGDTYVEVFSNVPAGSQVTFRGLNTGTVGGMPAGTLASATIEGTGDIVATVNEANSLGKAVYSCFNSDNATAKVALPQVKELFYGMTNGVIVQNVDTTSTTVELTYVQGGSTYILTYDLGVGEAKSFYLVSDASRGYTPKSGSTLPASGAKYAVTVESTGGQKIVAIAQEADVDAGNGVLDLKNYEGFSLQ
jgi:hypothetical protein